MTENTFIKEISKKCKLSDYTISAVYNASANLIAKNLAKGEDISIPELGVFTLASRKPMIGKNLFGENEKHLKACQYPIFKINGRLKSQIKSISATK